LFKSKTPSTDLISYQRTSIPVYIDTKNLQVGDYSLYIMLHYLDKDVGEEYVLHMLNDKVTMDKISGLVVGGKSGATEEEGGVNSLLIVAIIIIIIVNVFLVLKLVRRKK